MLERESRESVKEEVPAQLSVQDDWLLRITPELVIDEAWLGNVNEDLCVADRRISAHATNRDLQTQAARERVFERLGLLREDHELFKALQHTRKPKTGTYPSPARFIENGRICAIEDDLIEAFGSIERDLFKLRVKSQAASQKWYEHSFIDTKDARGTLPETTRSLARVLNLQTMLEPVAQELPMITADSPQRQIVMARIALELFDIDEFKEPEAIARFLQLSPEVALLVGTAKKKARLSDVEDFIAASSRQDTGITRVNRRSQVLERKKELRKSLSEPEFLFDVLGSAALNSYFSYAPPGKEAFRYAIGKIFHEFNQAKEKPRIDKSHLEWMQRLVGDDTKPSEEWLRRMNHLAFLGSKKAIQNANPLFMETRKLFYSNLNLDSDEVKKSRELPTPYHFLKVANILQDYGVVNIDIIARESFRIFAEGASGLRDKLDLISSKGYDVAEPEVQSLLAPLLRRGLGFLREKLLEYRPGMTIVDTLPDPIRKKKQTTSRKTSTDKKATPTPLTIESWRQTSPAEVLPKAELSEAALTFARLAGLYLDINQSERVLALQLKLERMSEAQLDELTEFVESCESELTLDDIRRKISTLEF